MVERYLLERLKVRWREIEILSAELAAKDLKIKDLDLTVRGATAVVSVLQDELAALKERNEDLIDVIYEKDYEIQQLKDEIEGLGDYIDEKMWQERHGDRY